MRNSRNIRMSTIGSVLVLGLTMAACGGGQSSDEVAAGLTGQEKEWYEAAQDEEPVRFYTNHTPLYIKDAITAFEEKYPGIEVDGLRLTSGDLMTRYSQEISADSRTADVIAVGDTRFTNDGLEKGYFETFDASEMPAATDLEERYFNQGVATALITTYGICYNSESVETAPENWEDVLDPVYNGRVVFPDFRNAAVYVWAGQHWADAYGPEFLADLEAQDPISADSMVPGLQSVANGQADIGLVCGINAADELVRAGAPIEVVYPDGSIAVPLEMAITADTASPNAAHLLYNFLLTEEGQEAFVSDGAGSPIGSKGSIPIDDRFVFPELDGYQDAFDLMAKHF